MNDKFLPIVFEPGSASRVGGHIYMDGKTGSLRANPGDNQQCVFYQKRMEIKVYGISPYTSHAMLSSNPHSGIYEATTTRTLDLNGGNPACNQGGMCILQPIKKKTVRQKEAGQIDNRNNGRTIILQRRFSNVIVHVSNITPTLEAGAGEGGNNLPMILHKVKESNDISENCRMPNGKRIQQARNTRGNE